jgi:hypothetical protein
MFSGPGQAFKRMFRCEKRPFLTPPLLDARFLKKSVHSLLLNVRDSKCDKLSGCYLRLGHNSPEDKSLIARSKERWPTWPGIGDAGDLVWSASVYTSACLIFQAFALSNHCKFDTRVSLATDARSLIWRDLTEWWSWRIWWSHCI